MKNFKRNLVSSMFALSFLAGSSALAGSSTANMTVSANVSNACTLNAGSLGFGAYDPTSGTAAAGSGTFTVTCTNGAALSFQLGQGANADAGSSDAAPLRRMASGADFLSYALFQDAGLTTPWGNTSGTGLSDTGTGAQQTFTMHGSMAAGQNAPAGSYSDTVLATVTF